MSSRRLVVISSVVLLLFLSESRSQNAMEGQASAMVVSPCPRMFQYRFDGREWFGIVSVPNPRRNDELHLHLTLSLRGKPPTAYIGEIELITRGQLRNGAPVFYKVRFPRTPLPPKLQEISINNRIICLGRPDRGIVVTQIKLEHTRRYTFVDGHGSDESSVARDSVVSSSNSHSAAEVAAAIADVFGGQQDTPDMSIDTMPLASKHQPSSGLRRVTQDNCGQIEEHLGFASLTHTDAGEFSNSVMPSMDAAGRRIGHIGHIRTDRKAATFHHRMPPIVTADYPQPPAVDDDDDANETPTISRGAWPWLAAIYVNNLTSLSYQCGGTLVSSHIVISAAHCFQMFDVRFTANEVLVFLGRHNLKNWNEEGSVAASCDDIFLHPEYDRHLGSYDADIAVIVLKNKVAFNRFIRPACMWSGPVEAEYIVGEHGIVVGWGLDVNGESVATQTSLSSSVVPKIINAPIIANDACFRVNRQFRSIASNRTFCAGAVTPPTNVAGEARQRRLSSGPCKGDSGAGLLIVKNNRWVLRGIVSATLPSKGGGGSDGIGHQQQQPMRCSGSSYVVYADVAKFLDWLYAFLI